MKPSKPSPKQRLDPAQQKTDELAEAKHRIKQLERELEHRNDEFNLLKKAERFFAKKKKVGIMYLGSP